MLKAAAGGGILVKSQRGKILLKLIIGNFPGKAIKMKTDKSDTPNVVVERTLALSAKDDLLLKLFINLVKALNNQDGFFNNRWFRSFFSSYKSLKISNTLIYRKYVNLK